jgi:aldehyde dehydrogenase family protein
VNELPGPKSREWLRRTQTVAPHSVLRCLNVRPNNEMPHGGYKQSGYGKDMGSYWLVEYTQIKRVMACHD